MLDLYRRQVLFDEVGDEHAVLVLFLARLRGQI